MAANYPNFTQSTTGSLTAANQAVTFTLNGEANASFQVTGTWVGTLNFEASNNNVDWDPINALKAGQATISQTITEAGNNDIYRCTTAGFGFVRARCSIFTSGTIIITANTSTNTSGVFLNFPLPAGTNTIGSAIARGGAKGSTTAADVTSTNVDANTQALDVSIKGLVATTLSGTPSVSVSNFPASQAVTGAFFQATQPVSLATNTPTLQPGSTTIVTQATASNLNMTASIAAAQTLATVTTVGTVTTLANGQTAHSTASTGSPVRVGGRVVATTAATQDQTLVAGDASDAGITTGQQLIIKPYADANIDWQFAVTTPIANTVDVVIKAASGVAGIRNYLTGISITNSSATIPTEVVVKDGLTVIWRGFVGANTLANSVQGVTFPTPLRGTANTALNVACITTAASVYVNAQGYTGV